LTGGAEGNSLSQGLDQRRKMRQLALPMLKNQYGQYLLNVIEEIYRSGSPNL